MTARARSQLGFCLAQSAHTASSPIGCGKGRPQMAHQGGAKNVMPASRAAQRVGLVDNHAASKTARRQDAIDHGAAEPAQLSREGCRKLHRFPSSACTRARQPQRASLARLLAEMPSDPPATALFDRRAWRLHRDRAARLTRGQGGGADFLHAEIADRLIDRLDLVSREFPIVLDLGARDGALMRTVAMRPGTVQVVAAEPSATFLTTAPAPRVAADPEFLPFRQASFDLIASVMALHWTADLPGALVQLRQALKPDGLFLAAMLGGQTLVELRTALF